MSDTPLDSIPVYDRVSIRAVLLQDDDENPASSLAEAGIFEPVAVPVLLGEDTLDLSDGILGDGLIPNIEAVLETDDEAPDAAA